MAVNGFMGIGDVQLFTNAGAVLASGKVNFYAAGTSTRKATYPTRADAEAATNANANPVVLNSAGRAEIWLDGTYKVTVTDSADVELWTADEVGDATAAGVFDKDHLAGLTISVDTDTDHDINATAGEARDDGDSDDLTLASEITKQGDATWAVGDDAGGMESGTSIGNATDYFFWLILRTDTDVVDVLISASSSSPTMPTSYDKKVLIGMGTTDGSANFITNTVGSVNRDLRSDVGGDLSPTIAINEHVALAAQFFS